MATRENTVKNHLLGHCQRLFSLLFLLPAFLLVAVARPAWAACEPVAPVVSVAAPATLQLAWDRVGSPLQIRA
jgi:hypothetical protein